VGVLLSTDLHDPTGVPYFLWDESMTTTAFRQRLATASPSESLRLLGKLLREAHDPDVWGFTSQSRRQPKEARHKRLQDFLHDARGISAVMT
jgi:hypothetical protein